MSRGEKLFKKHLNGEKLTRNQAIIALCFDCTGGFDDGLVDCEIKECPVHPYMPFRNKKPKKIDQEPEEAEEAKEPEPPELTPVEP